MANTTIYVKGPDFSGQIAAPAVTIDQIPNNIELGVGNTLDMSQYINDPGGVRTSTEVLTNGNPLPDPWFVSYSFATELLTGDSAGQATGLTLKVTHPGGTVESNAFETNVTTSVADIYVTKSGNNSWDGTTEVYAGGTVGPKLTIAAGIAAMSGGQTLQISGGTYVGTDNYILNPPSGGGSWATATQIVAKSGETVTIQATGNGSPSVQPSSTHRLIRIDNRSYIIFDGINLDGDNKKAYNCIRLEGTANNIRFTNHEHQGSYFSGVSDSSTNGSHQFINVTVHDCGVGNNSHGIYLSSPNNLVEDCVSYSNGGNGLQVWSANDGNVFKGNWCYDNYGHGITALGGNCEFYNNLCTNNATGTSASGIRSGGGDNNKLYHNTCYGNSQGVYLVNGSGHEVKNNILYLNGTAILDNSTGATKTPNTTVDPSFVNAGADNFHLDIGSVARNSGDDLFASVPDDFDDVERDTSPDNGAFEYVQV